MSNVEFINPAGLINNPAFSQMVIVNTPGQTIYIGGQNSINANKEIIGNGDLQLQTEQVLSNIEIALAAAGATFDNVVKLNIYIAQGQDVRDSFAAAGGFLNKINPPIITVLIVAAMANPGFLIEIDAVAVK